LHCVNLFDFPVCHPSTVRKKYALRKRLSCFVFIWRIP
ncbi:hypothetical protein GCK32_014981, partial [Trichostrongylus colubriformis]